MSTQSQNPATTDNRPLYTILNRNITGNRYSKKTLWTLYLRDQHGRVYRVSCYRDNHDFSWLRKIGTKRHKIVYASFSDHGRVSCDGTPIYQLDSIEESPYIDTQYTLRSPND